MSWILTTPVSRRFPRSALGTQTLAALLSLSLGACAGKSPSPAPVAGQVPVQPAISSNDGVPASQPAPTTLLKDGLPAAGFYNNSDNPVVYAMVDGATISLDIEIYQMSDKAFFAGIRRALARGVRVRVVREPAAGDGCKIFAAAVATDDPSCADQKLLRDQILVQGGAFVPFNKATLCADPTQPCVEHGKMVIADQNTVMISTGNFNPTNLCDAAESPARCDRDFSFVIRNSAATSLLGQVFDGDLRGVSYDLKGMLAATEVQAVTVSPWSLAPLIAFIGTAKRTIRLENQYLKEPALNQALVDAAQRGVHVEITLASACAFGHPSAADARLLTRLMTPFDAAGISVAMLPTAFRINGTPGYLHAKAIVVDEATAWVGSVNGSNAALTNNREFGYFFSGAADVANLNQILRDDHASPDMESWNDALLCTKDELSGGGTAALR